MPFTTAWKDTTLDAFRAAYPYAGLHSGVPTTGNEVTGGSPAYARLAHGIGAAASGVATGGALVFDVPTGASIAYLGYWTALTGGTCGGYDAVTTRTTTAQDTYTVATQSLALPN